MSITQAIILAIVQGITEFLPVSSSAHLILAPRLLGWADQGLVFDIATNTGSMLAVMVYFWRDLLQVAQRSFALVKTPRLALASPAPLGPALVVATFPILIAGVIFSDWISTAGRDPQLIAADAIVFGLLLLWADRTAHSERTLDSLRWRDAVGIGLAQALALMPGTSRSGVTMTAGLFSGLTRSEAARFSFLLSIPVGMAVLVWDIKELIEHGPPSGGWPAIVVGLVVSAITSYLVIGFLLGWLRRAGMTVFVVYRVLLGLTILAVYHL